MKNPRSRSKRGFTLIELMITSAIIGVLASVAIPSFLMANNRAKAAERKVVVRSIKNSVNALRVKDGTFGAGITGLWNPPLPYTTLKRPFLPAQSGWDKLDLTVDGSLYYSYEFWADETAGADGLPGYWISVEGDVDGNGEIYSAIYGYQINQGVFLQTNADPPSSYERMVF